MKKFFLVVTIFGTILCTSCTPERMSEDILKPQACCGEDLPIIPPPPPPPPPDDGDDD